MTDRAIKWIRQQKALMADKPFFAYFAPGATHAPHHVPTQWSAKYRGAFDQGWDRLREETFARQKELGVIPPEAELTARPEEIPAWEDIPGRPEAGAGAPDGGLRGLHGAHRPSRRPADRRALYDLGVLDDTLVYYIVGDNGASAEGGVHGCFNELIPLNGAGALETTEFMAARIDTFGTPEAYIHYSVSWAHAMDTPYQWTKHVASHWGGTRNGLIVHWPDGIHARGELRNQFHHVIDIAPTVLEVAELPEPARSMASSRSPTRA